MFRRKFLSWIVLGIYRVLAGTWRTTVVASPEFQADFAAGKPLIFAHWHRDELAVLKHVGRFRIATMTSHSKDGQLIDFVIRRLGGATAKGSSSRGGAGALRTLVRLVKSGYNASIAVDGPRGPIYRAKAGVFELSKLTGARIIPVGIASRNRYIFARAWNQARLPLPFTRIVVVLGEPIALPTSDTGRPDLKCPQLAAALDAKITAACHQARAEGLRLIGPAHERPGGFAPPVTI